MSSPVMILRSTIIGVMCLVAVGCGEQTRGERASLQQSATVMLGPPVLSVAGSSQTTISLEVCGGPSGAPFGFSVQWMTSADYATNGGWPLSDSGALCKASFSGTPQSSINRFSLAAGACTTVEIGNLFDEELGVSFTCNDDLTCGTEYVFRAFAHAGTRNRDQFKRSPFTVDLFASTAACTGDQGCTYTQGYWKTHNPTVCATDPGSPLCIEWPVSGLTLGTVSYSVDQLLAIFGKPAAGNGLLALAHQLIAAKLNVASGADGSAVATAIADADALIGGLVVPPVGTGFLSPSVTSSLTGTLDDYNKGTTGPGHCD